MILLYFIIGIASFLICLLNIYQIYLEYYIKTSDLFYWGHRSLVFANILFLVECFLFAFISDLNAAIIVCDLCRSFGIVIAFIGTGYLTQFVYRTTQLSIKLKIDQDKDFRLQLINTSIIKLMVIAVVVKVFL